MVNKNMTPKEFQAHIEKVIRTVNPSLGNAVEKNAHRIKDDAKNFIGEYQGPVGPFAPWARLDPDTVEAKGGHRPLLDSGEMRDSIHVTNSGLNATVGSNSDIAMYQELGTKDIPARSFLGRAAYVNAEHLAKDIGETLIKAIMGSKK